VSKNVIISWLGPPRGLGFAVIPSARILVDDPGS